MHRIKNRNEIINMYAAAYELNNSGEKQYAILTDAQQGSTQGVDRALDYMDWVEVYVSETIDRTNYEEKNKMWVSFGFHHEKHSPLESIIDNKDTIMLLQSEELYD